MLADASGQRSVPCTGFGAAPAPSHTDYRHFGLGLDTEIHGTYCRGEKA